VDDPGEESSWDIEMFERIESQRCQQDGAANRSQPFSSQDKTYVIGGWLPSLTSSFVVT
jgi:hypothetical protein